MSAGRRLVPWVIAGSLLLVAPAVAGQETDPAPEVDRWGTEDQTITFDHVPGGASNEADGPPQMSLVSNISFHKVSISGEEYTADALRDAVENGNVSNQDLSDFLSDLRSRFRETLTSSLPVSGGIVTTSPAFNRSSLEAGTGGSPFHPPVNVSVAGAGELDLGAIGPASGADLSEADVEAALVLGGNVRVPMSIVARPGLNVTSNVEAPQGLTFEDGAGLDVSEEGVEATGGVENWRTANRTVSDGHVTVTDPDEKAYGREEIQINVSVDHPTLDIALTSFPTGSAGSLSGSVVFEGAIRVVELPKGTSPTIRKTGVTHLSADDIRYLHQEGHLDERSLADDLVGLTEEVKNETPEGVEVDFRGGLSYETLGPPDPQRKETEKPVRFRIVADGAAELSRSTADAASRAQSITLYSWDRTVEFPALAGYETHYRFVAPQGIVVEDVVAEGATAETGTTDEGRSVLSLVVPSDEADTQMTVGITPSFLLHVWEAIALLFLAAVVAVGGATLWRRRDTTTPDRIVDDAEEGVDIPEADVVSPPLDGDPGNDASEVEDPEGHPQGDPEAASEPDEPQTA